MIKKDDLIKEEAKKEKSWLGLNKRKNESEEIEKRGKERKNNQER